MSVGWLGEVIPTNGYFCANKAIPVLLFAWAIALYIVARLGKVAAAIASLWAKQIPQQL